MRHDGRPDLPESTKRLIWALGAITARLRGLNQVIPHASEAMRCFGDAWERPD